MGPAGAGGDPDLGSDRKSLCYPLKVVGRVRDCLLSQSRGMSAGDPALTSVVYPRLMLIEGIKLGRML